MNEALRFDGRVAIVTGGARGVGRALAVALSGRGAKVLIGDQDIAADDVAAEIRSQGFQAMATVADLSQPEGAGTLVESCLDHFGRIDIVINNAGIVGYPKFIDLSFDDFRRTIDVNVGSAFCVTKAAWPWLVRQGYGRVMLATSQGIYGSTSAVHYCTSKAALLGMMRGLSVEGREYGINVNGYIPFAFTAMAAKTTQSSSHGRFTDALAKVADVEAALSADLVTPGVAWLCHEDCDLTGEVVLAGAGRFAKLILGETQGVFNPAAQMEDIRDDWDSVSDSSDFLLPQNAQDSVLRVFDMMPAPGV